MTTTLQTSVTEPVSTRRAWAAVAVLSASLLVVTMDMTILNIALRAARGTTKDNPRFSTCLPPPDAGLHCLPPIPWRPWLLRC